MREEKGLEAGAILSLAPILVASRRLGLPSVPIALDRGGVAGWALLGAGRGLAESAASSSVVSKEGRVPPPHTIGHVVCETHWSPARLLHCLP